MEVHQMELLTEPGGTYCCLRCYNSSNNHYGRQTHIVSRRKVQPLTLNPYSVGLNQADSLNCFKAYKVVNVRYIEAREEDPDYLAELVHPYTKTMDIHCVKCRSHLGWVLTDRRRGPGQMGKSFRYHIIDCSKIILGIENI